MKHDYEACLNDITRIVKDIVWGDAEQVRALFRYTNDPSVPASVGRLAEQIGTLIVQKEVREFQLENLIEDLFSTRTALAQARHDPLTGLPNTRPNCVEARLLSMRAVVKRSHSRMPVGRKML